jgi:hypothetical protein
MAHVLWSKGLGSARTRDQRASPRHLTFKTGKIVSLSHDLEILSAILDISDGGACLLVPDIKAIPDRFQFFADRNSQMHCCEVRWKSGHKIGIRFY